MNGFNKRLKAVLVSKGINQKQLAEMTGLHESMISYMVNDDNRDFSYKAIIQVCKALEVSSDYLLGLPTFDTELYNSGKVILLLEKAIQELTIK